MKKALLLLTITLASLAVAAQPPRPDRGMEGKRDPRGERRDRDSDTLAVQRHRERQEQIQLRKAAYFATKLELTPDGAQAFFPLYNEYWQRRDRLFVEQRSLMQKIQRGRFDDAQAPQVVQRIVAGAQGEADLLREYSERFAKVLPPQKLLRYFAAEESFKLELINDLRKRGEDRPGKR